MSILVFNEIYNEAKTELLNRNPEILLILARANE